MANNTAQTLDTFMLKGLSLFNLFFKAAKISIFIGILSLWSCKSTQSVTLSPDFLTIMKADVKYLSSDELEGRETGTEGERKASEYIAQRFTDIGLKGIFHEDNSFYQKFQKTIKSNPHATEANPNDPVVIGRNVGGFLDNNAEYTVIIGAHYDHLGYGGEGSLHTGPPAIHNGADDNASGVAIMLAMANFLKDKDLDYNFLFLAFSGEEKGLWGSNFFVDNSPLELEDINYMINLDMVGRLNDEKKLALYGTGTSPTWEKAFAKTSNHGFSFTKSESGVGPSDHTSFYFEDIPVLMFFTGQHADYHRPSDDYHLINFEGMADITKYLGSLVMTIDKQPKMVFTKTKDESQDAPAFKVTLGVIPDYLFDGKGMRIDGVREDRPASNAGLKKGDIVLKMGDLEIVDMQTYMKALSVFEPGQTITITIMREGDMMMEKPLTFLKK